MLKLKTLNKIRRFNHITSAPRTKDDADIYVVAQPDTSLMGKIKKVFPNATPLKIALSTPFIIPANMIVVPCVAVYELFHRFFSLGKFPLASMVKNTKTLDEIVEFLAGIMTWFFIVACIVLAMIHYNKIFNKSTDSPTEEIDE